MSVVASNEIILPKFCLVALVGVSGSGKSTFAKRLFKPTEILSSDLFRAMIADDDNDQSASAAAFDALFYLANKRLDRGALTVIDATSVQEEARKRIVDLAKEQNCHAIAIVLNVPEKICVDRNAARSDRDVPSRVVRRQADLLRRSIGRLEKEGFRRVYILSDEDRINAAQITRAPLVCDKKDESGPFEVIGDVHGCFDELCLLLRKLGYEVDEKAFRAAPIGGRKAVFLGDLCDRGRKNVAVLRLVMNMVKAGDAYCVLGNHDLKLLKYLKGAKVTTSHGLDLTIAELQNESEAFREETKNFLDSLSCHYVFDEGKLVVAHAGLQEKMQGRESGRVKEFCVFGETTGETDEYGLPERVKWANEYRGRALVVYGHTPDLSMQNVNNAICIDGGCAFGGKLAAYRYPEGEIVTIDALAEYCKSPKPLTAQNDDDMLDIDDVLHKRQISTRLQREIHIPEENAAAAFETMSRFAVDPHWLIYLPPTMSPCETSADEDFLERPIEAFNYYGSRGVSAAICEEKHMGSRSIVVLCQSAEVAKRRFKANDGKRGAIYTRTGRSFFDDDQTEAAILERLDAALSRSGFWKDFNTDWVCLDCELMPWSAKAKRLLIEQYAPVAAAGRAALEICVEKIAQTAKWITIATDHAPKRGESSQSADLQALLVRCLDRKNALDRYAKSYGGYCLETQSIDDYRLAAFCVLATENKTWSNESRLTHLETIKKYITGSDDIFIATQYTLVDTLNKRSIAEGEKWWEKLTDLGGEGIVVKPLEFIAAQNDGSRNGELLQSAIKCRGKEYLRIIYGPEYTLRGNLSRLKKRSLGKKRNLALKEFALGIEALERFVKKEPLTRVHECVFGVLALESEAVDPRL
ncbi:MAG: polynucleotide kinase-phosphatase [Helicobacteraceae bacterium]|jgi:protein phosphatase|nr:polynucleotide kinase-phosphatase [Helicobacteraceae bacterium]